jgi:hypothetical protein
MSRICDSPLRAAKARLTIPELWTMSGLLGKPGRSCRSPFRADRNPSFSIYGGGRKWADSAKESIHLALPLLLPYSKEPAQRVADSGGLRVTAIEFAALWLRTLLFELVCDQERRILTDASRRCAEARRIEPETLSRYWDTRTAQKPFLARIWQAGPKEFSHLDSRKLAG